MMINAYNETTRKEIAAQDVVEILKSGNKRFLEKSVANRDLLQQVEQTAHGQWPIAAVVSCIDSRVPVEAIFDLGIGDVFSARIAGNFVNADLLGSLEFACAVAGAKAIVVLGHTNCGAVKGACDDVQMGNLTSTLANIRPAVDAITDITENRNSTNFEFVQKVADKNVELTISNIKEESPILKEMIDKEEIVVAGAMYDVATGSVVFYS